jgi:hypothetical protein
MVITMGERCIAGADAARGTMELLERDCAEWGGHRPGVLKAPVDRSFAQAPNHVRFVNSILPDLPGRKKPLL